MREAYRLNKAELLEAVVSKDLKIRILVSLTIKAYNHQEGLTFAGLAKDMNVLLTSIKRKLTE